MMLFLPLISPFDCVKGARYRVQVGVSSQHASSTGARSDLHSRSRCVAKLLWAWAVSSTRLSTISSSPPRRTSGALLGLVCVKHPPIDDIVVSAAEHGGALLGLVCVKQPPLDDIVVSAAEHGKVFLGLELRAAPAHRRHRRLRRRGGQAERFWAWFACSTRPSTTSSSPPPRRTSGALLGMGLRAATAHRRHRCLRRRARRSASGLGLREAPAHRRHRRLRRQPRRSASGLGLRAAPAPRRHRRLRRRGGQAERFWAWFA
jgi:hypothetical protein